MKWGKNLSCHEINIRQYTIDIYEINQKLKNEKKISSVSTDTHIFRQKTLMYKKFKEILKQNNKKKKLTKFSNYNIGHEVYT